MRSGKLARHRFIWQRPDTSAATGYTPVVTLSGALRFASGSEVFRLGAPTATVFHVIEMRYRDDIRADWRAVDERSGRIFHVTVPSDPTDRRQELHVFCTEVK